MPVIVVFNVSSSVQSISPAIRATKPIIAHYSRWCRIRRSRSFAAKWLRSTIAVASFRLRLHHPRGTVLSVCFIRPTFCQLAHHRPPTSPSEATATVIYPISATRGSVDTSRRTPKHQLSPPASHVRRISESPRRRRAVMLMP